MKVRAFAAYVITNQINGKQYVGIAIDPRKRWSEHRRSANRGSDAPVHKAISKYGVNSFSSEVIASARSWQDLLRLERDLIKQYQTGGGRGYNQTLGGEGILGYRHTEAARAVMSQAVKRRTFTDESKAKMSIAKIGKCQSPEHKSKVGAAFSGTVWITDGSSNRRVSSLIKFPDGWAMGRLGGWTYSHSEGTKRRMSETRKGAQRRPHTPEAKENMRVAALARGQKGQDVANA